MWSSHEMLRRSKEPVYVAAAQAAFPNIASKHQHLPFIIVNSIHVVAAACVEQAIDLFVRNLRRKCRNIADNALEHKTGALRGNNLVSFGGVKMISSSGAVHPIKRFCTGNRLRVYITHIPFQPVTSVRSRQS